VEQAGGSVIISPIGALSFVQGGLNGILDGAGMATLVTAAPEGSIGAATALYFVSYTGAQALGNAAAGVFVTKYGFASMGTVMAAGSVPLLLFAMAVLPSGRVADNAAPAPRETAGAVASDSGGGKQSSSSYWDVIRTCFHSIASALYWNPVLFRVLADRWFSCALIT
jgi:hypothetical protein